MAPTSSSSSAEAQRRYANQQPHTSRMHLGRLQMRAYHDEMRGAIRPRSQELQSSTAAVPSVNFASQPAAHPNISFVRPTFSKPADLVSTTTHSGGVGVPGNAGLSEVELPTPSTAAVATPNAPSSSNSYLSQRHGHNHVHGGHQQVPPSSLASRMEVSNPQSGSVSNGGVELCDCKSDPDAMFLMSLLPDIQKLNGRDRGKIKIAFQNILQDYLYPD